jgi:hypothetical protein
MTNEQIDEIYNKLSDIGRTDLGDLFLSNPEGFDWSVLENDPNFVEKYKSIEDFTGDKFKIMGNLYNQFNGKKLTPERFEQLQTVYPWLNREEIDAWFDKTNQYKKMYEDQRKAEAGKMIRKKEIEDEWILQNLLASDYSKQRYINNPDESIFGKEGKFNPYSRGGQEELRDVMLGGTAAVADFIPGWGALIGPTIRTGRDVYHAVDNDSQYKKDLSTILKDAGTDYATNVGAWILSNARKGAKAANELASNDVKRSINFANESAAVKEGLKQMTTGVAQVPSLESIKLLREFGTGVPYNDIVLKNTVMDLPESAMKRELLPLVSNIKDRPIDRAAVQDIINKYTRESMPAYQQAMRDKAMRMEILPDEARKGSEFLENAIAAKPFSELGNLDKGSFLLNRLSTQINKGNLGQIMVQEGANLYGRGSAPNVVETALQRKEKEDTIDRIIGTYSILWSKKNPPPEAKDNPIIKAAWEKWSKQ